MLILTHLNVFFMNICLQLHTVFYSKHPARNESEIHSITTLMDFMSKLIIITCQFVGLFCLSNNLESIVHDYNGPVVFLLLHTVSEDNTMERQVYCLCVISQYCKLINQRKISFLLLWCTDSAEAQLRVLKNFFFFKKPFALTRE